MEDHSLEIQLFFFGSGFLSGLEAMKERRWRAYILWGITAVCVLSGIFWGTIKAWSPPVTAFITKLATDPESWFILLVLAIVWLVVSGRSKSPAKDGDTSDTSDNQEEEGVLDEVLDSLSIRLRNLEENVSNILHRQIDHISTPQLRIELEKQIREADVGTGKLLAGVVTKLEKQDKDILQKLEDIHNHNIQSKQFMAAQIAYTEKQIDNDYTDIKYMLIYISRSLDIMLIDWTLGKYPESDKRIIQLRNEEERKKRSSDLQQFITYVRGDLFRSWLNAVISQPLEDAKYEAERKLKLIPPDQRPSDTDHVDLLRYMTNEEQARALVQALLLQRDAAMKGLRGQRETIEQRLGERQTPRKVSIPADL